jgi:hypothetical protein
LRCQLLARQQVGVAGGAEGPDVTVQNTPLLPGELSAPICKTGRSTRRVACNIRAIYVGLIRDFRRSGGIIGFDLSKFMRAKAGTIIAHPAANFRHDSWPPRVQGNCSGSFAVRLSAT